MDFYTSTKRRTEAPCTVCGTTRFSIDALGHKFCQYGHQVEGFQEEALEYEDLGKMKQMHTAKGRRGQKQTTYYFGSNYRFLQLQLFQYALHLQCKHLINNHGFPVEFEDAVKELFLLYVNWNDELFIEVDKLGHPVPKKLFGNLDKEEEVDKDLESLDLSSNDGESDRDSDNISKPKTKNNSGERALKFRKSKQRAWHYFLFFKGSPSKIAELTLPYSIGFLYLGAKALKLNILLLDLQQLATNNQLPFRNMLQLIPESYYIRYKLDFLITAKIPSLDKLEQIVNYLEVIMSENYDIKFLPLNVPLIIYRLVTHFELPPAYFHSIYYIFNKLNIYTGYDVWFKNKSPFIKIIGIFIIVMKLVFGFDGKLRSPDPIFKLETSDCDKILIKFNELNKNYYKNLKPKNLSEYIERFQNNQELTIRKLKELFPEDGFQTIEPGEHKSTLIDGTPNNVIMKVLNSRSPNQNNSKSLSLPQPNSDFNHEELPISFEIPPPNEDPIKPGSQYPRFMERVSNTSELPSFYLRLLSCLEDYCQLPINRLNIIVKLLEAEFFNLKN